MVLPVALILILVIFKTVPPLDLDILFVQLEITGLGLVVNSPLLLSALLGNIFLTLFENTGSIFEENAPEDEVTFKFTENLCLISLGT